MAIVSTSLSMSLDGFIALPDDSVGPLFDWYDTGDVEFRWPGMGMVSHTSPQSAAYLRDLVGQAGALVVGRRVFDYTNGWGGEHPVGVPVFVVSHTVPDGWPRGDAPFTFVTDGVEAAVAQAKQVAGDKAVSLAGPSIVQQCLNLGLLDEVHIELVPVLLGEGIRFFDHVQHAPVMFDDPVVVEGTRVTHLRYRLQAIGSRAPG
jgi:dihydrofolate reductase